MNGRTWAARSREAGEKMEQQDGRGLGACVPYSDREKGRRCARRSGLAAALELRALGRTETYHALLEGARAQGRLAAATPIVVRPETDAEARARTKRWRDDLPALGFPSPIQNPSAIHSTNQTETALA